MKRIFLALVMTALFISSSSVVKADERYMGVKTGFFLIDARGVDDVIPVGIVYGRNMTKVNPNFWLEGEFNFGLLGGDVPGGGDLDIWTIAAYGAYRYPLSDTSYLKGKAGLLYQDSDFDDDINLSVGIGGGFQIDKKLSLEGEFTIIESDVNFLSIAANCKF